MRQLITTAVATLATTLATTVHCQTKWDMPTPYPDGTFHTKNIQQFASDVERATGGKLRIIVHSAGSLIRHQEIKRTVRAGTTPIGEVMASLASNESPIYSLDSVPFLATNYADARRLYAVQRPYLEKLLSQEGVTLLFSVPWPPQALYAKREITSVEDLRGRKFRTYNVVTGRIAALIGAIPTQIEVPDIPIAFATGRVEAMITSPSTGVDIKAWDFLSHFHDVKAWLNRNIVIVNNRALAALPEPEKAAVSAAAKAAEERGWKLSEEESSSKAKTLAENGMVVVQPSDRLKKELTQIGARLLDEWVKTAGSDGPTILKAYRGN